MWKFKDIESIGELMVKLISYGTLREGFYNFYAIQALFGEESIKKIETLPIKGIAICYSQETEFPYGVSAEGTAICDILEVTQEVAEYIDEMEKGAGYEKVQLPDTSGNLLDVYLYKGTLPLDYTKDVNADWTVISERLWRTERPILCHIDSVSQFKELMSELSKAQIKEMEKEQGNKIQYNGNELEEIPDLEKITMQRFALWLSSTKTKTIIMSYKPEKNLVFMALLNPEDMPKFEKLLKTERILGK